MRAGSTGAGDCIAMAELRLAGSVALDEIVT